MCLKRKCELIVLHPVKLQYLPIIIRIIRNNNKQKPSSFTTNTNKQQLLPPQRIPTEKCANDRRNTNTRRKERKERLNYTKKSKMREKKKGQNEVNQRLTGVIVVGDIIISLILYTSISTSMERDFNTFGDE